jgi:beta-glucosidase
MTLAQQLNEIRGLQAHPIDGLYYAGGDADLQIAAFKMVDGPRGARTGKATAFPVAMARGATFDVYLERRVGLAIGLEVAARGGNVLLAPTINLLRHPGWGRAQETYSEDSFHMGAMGAAFISGTQNHVMASPKHFAVNNVENTRFEMTSDLSPRVLHEVYLPHFKRCIVEAGAASIMSAYNKLNGTYCGEHPDLLTTILRDDWGFKGFVESDWFLGTRSTSGALNAGLDIEMPAGYRFSDENIYAAIKAGDLSEATIRQAAGRCLYAKLAWDLLHQVTPEPSVVESEEHLSLAREVAEKSMVLLKNEGQILPLSDAIGQRYAVVGDMASIANLGDRGSSFVTPTHGVSPLQGIRDLVSSAEITFFSSEADLSTLGDFDAAIVVAGLNFVDEGEFIPTQQQEAGGDDLARGGDRELLTLPLNQKALIERVSAQARQTIVVLEGGSAIEMRAWVDQVQGLLMAWYPGCEGGHAIAAILFGTVNPSGRLPVSIPRQIDQHVPWDITSLQVQHDYLQGYAFMQANQAEPEYAFGFGMSYTSFALESLTVQTTDVGLRVSVDVTNTGALAGATVVQLYVSCTDSMVLRAPRALKGFGRVELEPAEQATLVMLIEAESLAFYDEDTAGWQLETCQYDLQVGFSCVDLPLCSSWLFNGEYWEPR